MRILAIRGMNLASLEGEFEVDFEKEPLKSAGIFAITGKTGAGKSTILDAISLALYAEVPRLMDASSKKEGEEELTPRDARRILRRGKGECYAEVDFEAKDGQRYRSRWEVRRAGKKPDGKIQGEVITVIGLNEGTQLQGSNRELKEQLERLIGLSFDQFRRTILLAQGDFAAFLKAEEKEKTLLLEKMTGTDIFRRISMRIYERDKEEQAQIKEIESLMSQIVLLPDDTLSKKQERLRDIALQVNQLKKRQEQLKSQSDWFKERTNREKALEEKKRELEEAIKEYNLHEPQRIELAEVESVQPIAHQFHKRKELENELNDKQSESQKLKLSQKKYEESLQSIDLRIQEAEKQLKSVEQSCEESEIQLKEARRLDGLLSQQNKEVEKLKRTLGAKSSVQLEKQIKALEDIQNKILTQSEREKELQNSLTAELSRLRSDLVDGTPCPVCGSLHHPAAGNHPPVAEEKERKEISSELSRLRLQAEQLREKIGGLRQLVQQEEEAAKELEVLKISLDASMTQRAQYFDGKDVDSVEQKLKSALKNARSECDKCTTDKRQIELDLKGNSVLLKEVENRISSLQSELLVTKNEIEDFLSERPESLDWLKLEHLLSHDAKWIKNQKEELKQCDDRLQDAKLVVKERERLLLEHLNDVNKPDIDVLPEKVKDEQGIVEKTLGDLAKEDKGLSYEIERESEKKKELERLRNKVEQLAPTARLWAQLNDLLGSANGNKFALIAQRYTITNLLGYANKQLEMIAPRYRLKQVDKDALNLVVIDTYMMDEERTVFSLSGGETFLVSLSLALGLSSLSSRHVSIQSLFIDEGFGSLDADTLAVALDALDTLQTQQGRLIGVISHVQEMNERIATQIQVKSNGRGGSTIAIKG